MSHVVRIANCSGFYGDRLAAAREMIEGGPIDVLTGDYLAELTMSILHSQRASRGEALGYVGTFLKQIEDVASLCKEKGIRIVSNAGGLNPESMAREVQEILDRLGVDSKVAWIDGDDLLPSLEDLSADGEAFMNTDTGAPLTDAGMTPVTANAYLGGWGIAQALGAGADIVICPRVTDAAVVIGPAAWFHGWDRHDYDALAGALAAGHIIECGAQCCGGNYAFFEEVPSYRDVGYPIAEIEADGSFTVTKHPGTGGLVSVGTIKAQLLYEIREAAYYNPDVIAHFDTMHIEQVGEDRVRVSGCRGSSPPPTHKVCFNLMGPSKQSFETLLSGLDIERKAEVFLDAVFHNLGGRDQFDDIEVDLVRSDKDNPPSLDEAFARLRVVVTTRDPVQLGRLFSAKVTELTLANIPGNLGLVAGGFNGTPVMVHWPSLVTSKRLHERVHIGDETILVQPTQALDAEPTWYQAPPAPQLEVPQGELVTVPLGRLYGARSGDKGGNGNCGIWATSEAAYAWLSDYLTVERFRELFPDLGQYRVERFDLPNLWAMNFYIHGMLGNGASSSYAIDRQAKSLGEYVRARHIVVPEVLL